MPVTNADLSQKLDTAVDVAKVAVITAQGTAKDAEKGRAALFAALKGVSGWVKVIGGFVTIGAFAFAVVAAYATSVGAKMQDHDMITQLNSNYPKVRADVDALNIAIPRIEGKIDNTNTRLNDMKFNLDLLVRRSGGK